MKDIHIKEVIKTGIILFCITAIAALLLAVANKITAPVIATNQEKRTNEAMTVIMPEAKDFKKLEVSEDGISEAYEAVDGSGKNVGVCVVSSANGYGGEIKVLVGVDSNKTVTGIKIMSHSETPGLGANAVKPEFYNQFAGKKAGIKAAKSNPDENDINAMSGATITSRAVTLAVNNALEYANGGNK